MDSPAETVEKPLYDTDFFRWSQVQAEAIRAAASVRINTPVPIDWENVAEEIEDLGKSVRRELRSRLCVVIEHLIKLSSSPAVEPRRGWHETVIRERSDIEQLLEENPSLERQVPELVGAEIRRAKKRAAISLEYHQESLTRPLDDLDFTPAQVLENWFPAEP